MFATLATSLVGCKEPPIDTDPPVVTGVIEGSVQYIGRRVDCDYDNGVPVAVRGRILMTLNDAANPLPPLGTATQPADFFAVGGEDIFSDLRADCLPEPAVPPDPVADAAARAVTIQRSTAFRWGSIRMGAAIDESLRQADGTFPQSVLDATAKHYSIQGFYDQEGDFNPLFSVTQSTSAGDIAGGALLDPLGSTAFRDLRFDSVTANPLGTLIDTVTVTLAGPAITDPPIFRVENGAISAEARVQFPATVASAMPAITLRLYERTPAGNPVRMQLDASMTALHLGGYVEGRHPIAYDFTSPLSYAWYMAPVDVDGNGESACVMGTNDKDCHPILGNFGFTWNSPVVLMQRYQTPIELQANIPTVAMIPNAGMEDAATGNPASQYPTIPLRVFPFAAMLPNPLHPECQAAYFSSGSSALIVNQSAGLLPIGSVLECSEFPTGIYTVNGLAGVVATPSTRVCTAAGEPGCAPVTPATSQTGVVVENAQFASQIWRIPNDLGDWHQVGDTLASGVTSPGPYRCLAPGDTSTTSPLCLPEQSLAGAVVVHDPNTANPYGRRDPAAAAGMVCTAYPTLGTAWSADPDPTIAAHYDDICCNPIRHLCDVPLCAYVAGGVTPSWADTPAEMSLNVRGTPTRIVNHVTATVEGVTHSYGVPDCIPFPMPTQCCGAANQQ